MERISPRSASICDFIQEILSHGNDIEVLAPVWLRNLVKEKAEALTALYK